MACQVWQNRSWSSGDGNSTDSITAHSRAKENAGNIGAIAEHAGREPPRHSRRLANSSQGRASTGRASIGRIDGY